MTKSLKFFLVALALISIGLSLAFYFEWWPFARKAETKVETPEATINSSSLTPGSCLILAEQYCDLGKPIYDSNNQLVGLGFKLPDGSKIYAPFKGQIEKNSAFLLNGKAYPSLELMDTSKDDWGRSQTRSYFYVTAYPQEPIATETIEKNQPLMTLVETNVEGDYNLILTFREYDVKANQGKTNLDLLKQFFPDLEK
jgi:hypothetical protein